MQTGFFDEIPMPESYEDVNKLYHEFIFEGETDTDSFTFTDTAAGRSYFFYGVKAFGFVEGARPKLMLPARVMRLLDGSGTYKDLAFYAYTKPYLPRLVFSELRQIKRDVFRSLVTETYACCSSFNECSDAGECIKAKDRFSNGCGYRRNLEAGRIFYGKRKNV